MSLFSNRLPDTSTVKTAKNCNVDQTIHTNWTIAVHNRSMGLPNAQNVRVASLSHLTEWTLIAEIPHRPESHLDVSVPEGWAL